jgi:hypothetical protein
MSYSKVAILVLALQTLAIGAASCQTTSTSATPTPAAAPATPPAQAPADTAPAAAPASVWSAGPIDFSGTVDGYYSFNFNHPDSGISQLYNFDDKTNQFYLNLAKLTINHDPDPVGVHLDIGYGRVFDLIQSSTEPAGTKYLEQAYISLKPPKAKGLEADFGKFVTSAGAEVIETKDNWNYSRSILFAWAIPYYHFGLRTSMPITKTFTGGVQVVNGWNNVEDTNSGKTLGFTGVYTKTKYTWSANYYTGPENAHSNNGFRNLFDTTILLTPNAKVNAYLNYDYGQNRDPDAAHSGDGNLNRWQGIAGAVHLQVTPTIAITPRAEWFQDYQGFSTGTAQTLNEVTLTAEYKMPQGFLARLEYRHDHSDHDFFEKGTPSETYAGATDNQSTLTAGFVVFFGPKH